MSYQEQRIDLDLSSAGRGLQQTLLLLAYMYANPGAVLLLDEPDAHLEILRQRQIYQLLTETAEETDSQIIAASHSEVLLNEATGRDMVIAFVGKPHRLDNRGSQVLKSLREIGFEHYYQAEQTGWVLFLEGSTDLSLLRAFAARLDHRPALRALERPYVHYVSNQPMAAANHFHALCEALPDLRGVALFDRLDREPPDRGSVDWLIWERREFENYVATRQTLERYAAASGRDATPGTLFAESEQSRRVAAMNRSIESIEEAMKKLGKDSPGIPTSRPATISLRRCSLTTSRGWTCRTSCRRKASMCWRGMCRGMRSTGRSGRSWMLLGGSRRRLRGGGRWDDVSFGPHVGRLAARMHQAFAGLGRQSVQVLP